MIQSNLYTKVSLVYLVFLPKQHNMLEKFLNVGQLT